MITLKQIYLLMKMIKFYKNNFNDPKFDLYTITLDGKNIEIKKIKEE